MIAYPHSLLAGSGSIALATLMLRRSCAECWLLPPSGARNRAGVQPSPSWWTSCGSSCALRRPGPVHRWSAFSCRDGSDCGQLQSWDWKNRRQRDGDHLRHSGRGGHLDRNHGRA